MHAIWQDMTYAFRMMRKNPGFTSVALVTLALGIGANTAIFSVVNAVLLRPLPFSEPARVVVVEGVLRGRPLGLVGTSIPDYEDWRKETRLFERAATLTYWTFNLTGRDIPERILGARVTGDFFPLLGAHTLLGRTLTPADNASGEPDRAVLSYGLWQHVFAGDKGVIGRTFNMNGVGVTVVGVMPQDFHFPAEEVEIWASMGDSMSGMTRDERFLQTTARLSTGVSLGEAQAAMNTISAHLAAAYPQTNTGWSAKLVPAQEAMSGDMREPLLVLLGAVGLVLLIACANVGNLLLSRAAARQKESAIRAALGASRARLIQQFLTENVLLSLAGGALGGLLAMWGTHAVKALAPADIPRLAEVRPDPMVFLFTAGVSLGTGIFLGLLPAIPGAARDLQKTLQQGGRSGAAGASGDWLRGGLVIAEIALAFVLLIGGGLLLRSFSLLLAVDPGFHPERILTMRAMLTPPKYLQIAQENDYVREALGRIARLPGVESVAASSSLPLNDSAGTYKFGIEGRANVPGDEPMAVYSVVTPSYFSTVGIPVLRGRGIAATDTETSQRVIVISGAMARKYWPGEDPVGKRIRWVTADLDANWQTVVGVAGDVRTSGLEKVEGAAIYAPNTQRTFSWLREVSFAVRTADHPLSHIAEVRRAILSVDPEQPLFAASSLEQIVSQSMAQRRFQMLLLSVFAGLALVLATVGTYGVISYAVTRRTSEIGIRMALGATPRQVAGLVLRRALSLTLGGLLLGCAGALALTRVLANLLFGVTPADPVTFSGVGTLLAVAAFVACTIPAWRATRVDPLTALRHE